MLLKRHQNLHGSFKKTAVMFLWRFYFILFYFFRWVRWFMKLDAANHFAGFKLFEPWSCWLNSHLISGSQYWLAIFWFYWKVSVSLIHWSNPTHTHTHTHTHTPCSSLPFPLLVQHVLHSHKLFSSPPPMALALVSILLIRRHWEMRIP